MIDFSEPERCPCFGLGADAKAATGFLSLGARRRHYTHFLSESQKVTKGEGKSVNNVIGGPPQ